MFSWRNKKNIYPILTLIQTYDERQKTDQHFSDEKRTLSEATSMYTSSKDSAELQIKAVYGGYFLLYTEPKKATQPQIEINVLAKSI